MILKLKNMNFININDIYIIKIVVSNKLPFGKQNFKYCIGYKDNKNNKSLCIFFPEVSIYKRCFDKTKCMYFMIKYVKFFDKYMKVWENVSNIKEKHFNTKLIYNKKYLKAE